MSPTPETPPLGSESVSVPENLYSPSDQQGATPLVVSIEVYGSDSSIDFYFRSL